MPSFRRRASAIDADHDEEPTKRPKDTSDATGALALAEEAEAEAAEAEAMAAAARARARAIRLRREAQAAETQGTNGVVAVVESEPADTVSEAEGDPEAEPESAAADDDEAVAGETSDIAIDEPEEESEEEPAPSGRRWGRVLRAVAMTLAILCSGALLAASGYMVVQHRHAAADQKLDAEYNAAGRQSVVTLMSLDFNNAEADVQRIIDNTTGKFREDFESQAADFIKVAQDSKVVTDVTVNSTAVESMDQDSAVVLVAATSRVSNSAGAKQEPRAWRLAVDLQRDGGQIKMSKVEFVP